MSNEKTKDFNEYLLENVQAAREETREFKKDINKRMDGLEKRMDELDKRMDRIETRMDKLEDKVETTRRELNQRMNRLEEKLDSSLKEIRDLVAESRKDIRSTTQHSQILTSTIVSVVVVVLFTLLRG